MHTFVSHIKFLLIQKYYRRIIRNKHRRGIKTKVLSQKFQSKTNFTPTSGTEMIFMMEWVGSNLFNQLIEIEIAFFY
jgi:hypothetical protein